MTGSPGNHKLTILLSLFIVGWIAGLLIESSRAPLQLLGLVQGLDKAAHFLAFCGLGLLVCALSFNLYPRAAIPLFSMPLFIVTLSGIIEESYQMFVPGRAADLLDLLADICGAACAIILANRVAYLMRANKRIRLD